MNTAGGGISNTILTSRSFRDFLTPVINDNSPTTGLHWGGSGWDDTYYSGGITDGSIEDDGGNDFVGASNFVAGTRTITEVSMDKSYVSPNFSNDDTSPDLTPDDAFTSDPE